MYNLAAPPAVMGLLPTAQTPTGAGRPKLGVRRLMPEVS
jgi:hypothetical protein